MVMKETAIGENAQTNFDRTNRYDFSCPYDESDIDRRGAGTESRYPRVIRRVNEAIR